MVVGFFLVSRFGGSYFKACRGEFNRYLDKDLSVTPYPENIGLFHFLDRIKRVKVFKRVRRVRYTNSYRRLFRRCIPAARVKNYLMYGAGARIVVIATENGRLSGAELFALKLKLARLSNLLCIHCRLRIRLNGPVVCGFGGLRMGRGKGSVKYWMGYVARGSVLIEFSRLNCYRFGSRRLWRYVNAVRCAISLRTYCITRKNIKS